MRMRLGLRVLILTGCLGGLASSPRVMGQKLPSAGSGKVKIQTRFYRAGSVFSPTSFGTGKVASRSTVSGRLTKINGEYGLNNNWALLIHARFASLDKTKKRKTSSAFGFQDQVIGLERGFRQEAAFTDAVDFKVVIPTGSTKSIPQLGTGHWAIEPDYGFAFTHHFRKRFVYANSWVGTRIFPDSGATQLRITSESGGRAFSKVNAFGTLFLSRTLEGEDPAATGGIPDATELYDLLRVGGGVEFAEWKSIRPMFAYQTDVAGQGIHAGSRIVFGMTMHIGRVRRPY